MALAWALRQGGQGHGSGVTPWPALHSLSASGRLTVGRGVGKMSRGWLTGGVRWQRLWQREEGRAGERRAADAWAQVVTAAGGAGRAGGRGNLGLLAGPACAHWAGWAERLGCEAFFSLSSFLSVSHFLSIV